MGYDAYLSGAISIDPPVGASLLTFQPEHLAESLVRYAWTERPVTAEVEVDGETVPTTGVARFATGIVPMVTSEVRDGNLEKDLARLIHQVPADRTVTGSIVSQLDNMQPGNLARIRVAEGRLLVHERVRVTWPDGTLAAGA